MRKHSGHFSVFTEFIEQASENYNLGTRQTDCIGIVIPHNYHLPPIEEATRLRLRPPILVVVCLGHGSRGRVSEALAGGKATGDGADDFRGNAMCADTVGVVRRQDIWPQQLLEQGDHELPELELNLGRERMVKWVRSV